MKKSFGLLLLLIAFGGLFISSKNLIPLRSSSELQSLHFIDSKWIDRVKYYEYRATLNSEEIVVFSRSKTNDFYLKLASISSLKSKGKSVYSTINNIDLYVFLRISILVLMICWGMLLLVGSQKDFIKNQIRIKK